MKITHIKGIIIGSILMFMASISFAEEETNKIVYLEIGNENLDFDSPFAGLVIEDNIELPGKNFPQKFRPAPADTILLSPSLRDYITGFQREKISSNSFSSD